MLNRGHIPIYEPGLAELVARNVADGRLRFTTDLPSAAKKAPAGVSGRGNSPGRRRLGRSLGPLVGRRADCAAHRPDCIVVCKSTVPVGTNAKLAARLKELTGRDVDVASNPEFLKEGMAIDDFMKPDRVVVGARRQEVIDVLADLYQPYLRTDKPLLACRPRARDDEVRGQRDAFDEDQLHQRDGRTLRMRRGRHQRGSPRHRPRQPHRFRLPLSRRGLRRKLFSEGRSRAGGARPAARHRAAACSMRSMRSTSGRKAVLMEKIERHFGGQLSDKAIAVWGLAFKPGTDDIREAPSLVLIERLLAAKATVRVYDPEAMDNVRALYGDRLVYCQKRDDAILGADALAVCTEWKQFVHPGLRGDAPGDAAAGDLRRPQHLQSPADASGRLHLLQHRPAGGEGIEIAR